MFRLFEKPSSNVGLSLCLILFLMRIGQGIAAA